MYSRAIAITVATGRRSFRSAFGTSRIAINTLFSDSLVGLMDNSTDSVGKPQRATRVLSLQSHTVHGFVGNKAATFPLQLLGFNVDAINTIVLSNKPGYSAGFKGKETNAEDLAQLIEGLAGNDLLRYDVVITGYARSVSSLSQILSAVSAVRAANDRAMVVCDPVLGDHGRFYVPEELLTIYKDKIIPLSSMVTPNAFEIEALTGIKIATVADALRACEVMHSIGPDVVLLKGIKFNDGRPDNYLSMVLSHRPSGRIFGIDFPSLPGAFSGCGDLCTALATAWMHRCVGTGGSTVDIGSVLENIASSMLSVLSNTAALDSKELCVIESRSFISSPPKLPNRSYLLGGPVVGVIFDMDGTLTEPGAIDFDAMYSRIGIQRRRGMDILTQVREEVHPDRHEEAHQIIVDEEMKGCDNMVVKSDLQMTIEFLQQNRIRGAISTRNCGEALLHFQEKTGIDEGHLAPILHRESLGGINKPDPRVAEHIMSVWGVTDPTKVWFVGDSADDMRCGKGAGCRTCLIAPSDYDASAFMEAVDVRVSSLSEFINHIGKY
jgi:pyridoxine kinase